MPKTPQATLAPPKKGTSISAKALYDKLKDWNSIGDYELKVFML
jgi:hypothetical protein